MPNGSRVGEREVVIKTRADRHRHEEPLFELVEDRPVVVGARIVERPTQFARVPEDVGARRHAQRCHAVRSVEEDRVQWTPLAHGGTS